MDIFYTGNVAWLHLDGCPRNLSQGQPVCKWNERLGANVKQHCHIQLKSKPQINEKLLL